MDLILARIDQLEEQARQQAVTNRAQASTNEAQAASTLLLSSENESLRRIVEDQDRVIGELSRVTRGFWVWESETEGERGRGRWVYSLEKYRSPPPLTVNPHAGPPTSLESRPNELLDLVISLLPQPDQPSLGRCSYRLLSSAMHPIYGPDLVLDSEYAAEFVFSRLSQGFAHSDRIRSLLLPRKLVLSRGDFIASNLGLLHHVPQHHPLLQLKRLVLWTDDRSTIRAWSPLLRLLDPRSFQIVAANYKLQHASPVFLSTEDLSFSLVWTRLESFRAFGPRSIPVPVGEESAFGLSECLLRGESSETTLQFEMSNRLLVGGCEWKRSRSTILAGGFWNSLLQTSRCTVGGRCCGWM